MAKNIIANSQGNQSVPGSGALAISGRLPLVLDKDGANPINLSLVVTSVPGTSTDCGGSIFWQEIR